MNDKDIRSTLSKLGSPMYSYNISEVRDAANELKSSLPSNSVLYYSLKANPHADIVKEIGHMNIRAEVSSANELFIALDSGIKAEHCLYTGPGKTVEEISIAINNDVGVISVDSPEDVRKIVMITSEVGKRVNIIIRINPSEAVIHAGIRMTGVPSQFGIDDSDAGVIAQIVKRSPLLNILGFHIYLGSNVQSQDELIKQFIGNISLAADLAKQHNINLLFLNIGGGFGHPYAKIGERMGLQNLKNALEPHLDIVLPGWRNGSPQLAFESGRYLVAGCGSLFSKIVDIKKSKGQTFIIIDSGINHFLGINAIGRTPKVDMDFEVLHSKEVTDKQDLTNATIVGPLCTPLDYLKRNAKFPSVQIGDYIRINNIGAYGLSASLNGFLSRDMPIEIVHYEGRIRSISQIEIKRKIKEDVCND